MRLTRKTRRGAGAALVVVALVATGCGSSSKSSSQKGATAGSSGGSATTGSSAGNAASAPGVTPTTIKIGFITSFTGNASSTFSTAETGAKAYFDALNKAGGIDGRQVELIAKDDASSPSGALSATQLLLNEGVYGIVVDSSYFFGAYKAAQTAGVPVTGAGFDGPEWGQQPNTNMFATIGGMDPNHPELQASLGSAEVAKFAGATNVGGLAYGISPSSTGSIKDTKTALESIGLKMGYENLSVDFGTTDVSTPVLAMKQANVNFAICSCVQSTVLAMVTGLKQAGSTAKSLSQAGADSSIFSSASATQAAQGMYYASTFPPVDTNNPASNTFVANIKAVDPSYRAGEYPSFGVVAGYLGSVLMAEGLQVAGPNPTRQSFIQNLTKVTSWDADGLLPAPVGFDHFGTAEKTYCEFYVKVQGQGFEAVNGGKPLCLAVPSTL
jgi:branched-chain amino acid transport system substrate-binding protein